MIKQLDIPRILGRAELDLKLARTARVVLVCGLAYGLFVGPQIGQNKVSNAILLAVCLGWLLLGIRARRKAALTATATQMIAAGQSEHAGELLAGIFRGFCLHKPVILMACHNLAVILQRRREWLAAWQFCELVRSQGSKRYSELTVVNEAVRANCSLALNNLPATYESLLVLSRLPLSISERLGGLLAEITYGIRSDHSEQIMADLPNKVALAQLMPTEQAGLAHGWLALAAHITGNVGRRDWLWQRTVLYRPAEELLAAEPMFKKLAEAISRDYEQGCTKQDGQIES